MKRLFTIVMMGISFSAFCQTWVGGTSNEWNDPLNWSSAVPTSTTDAIIPGGTLFSPVISTIPAAACRNLDIQGGSILTISAGGDLQLYGNLVAGGTFTHTAGTFELLGHTPQTIDGIAVYDIRVNNDSGTILNGNLIVNDTLSLIKGIITTGAYIVDLHDTTANKLVGGNDTSYINGKLRRAVVDTALYAFPIGSASKYELAEVHFNANPGKLNGGIDSLIAFYVSGDSGCTGISGPSVPVVNGSPLTDLLNGGYWTIHPDTNIYNGVSYDITVHEKGADNTPAIPQSCTVVKRPACDSAWVVLGVHNNNTQSFSDSAVNARRSQLSSFSDFGIGFGNGGQALPVGMLYVEAKPIDNSYIQVAWAVAFEINNSGFEVERSTDAQTWNPIGWIDGNGNATQQIDYTFNDMSTVFNVQYYYRLKQVDFNGNYKYHNMVSAILKSNAAIAIGSVVPNPVLSTAHLAIATLQDQVITIDIYSMLGQKVSSSKYNITHDSSNKIELDVRNLPAGIYSALIATNFGTYTKRLEVSK